MDLADPKALPHSEESERAVLAAILLDPSRYLPTGSRRGCVADDFYLERHQRLYRGDARAPGRQGTEIDLRTLQAKLEQQKQLEAVGGLAYLATLDVDLPDLGRVDAYVEIVKERSLRRRLIDACADIYRDCLDGGLDAQAALDRAEQAILELGEEAIPRGFVTLGRRAPGDPGRARGARRSRRRTGVPTGFDDCDRMTPRAQPAAT